MLVGGRKMEYYRSSIIFLLFLPGSAKHLLQSDLLARFQAMCKALIQAFPVLSREEQEYYKTLMLPHAYWYLYHPQNTPILLSLTHNVINETPNF